MRITSLRTSSLALSLTSMLACSGGGNSPSQPNPSGTECSSQAAGWQHECIGEFQVFYGPPDTPSLLYQESGYSYYFDGACCEGEAVKATADAACQNGCYSAACGAMLQQLDENGFVIDENFFDPYGHCLIGGSVPACNGQDCYNFRVECDMMSNELFDTDGTVPLEILENREWCGSAAQYAGETGETGDVEIPAGSILHVDLSPTETSVLVDWTSRTWGSNSLSGNGTGYAEYRIETCPSGMGDCIYLRKLVVYGGDIEVNGVEATNLIAQLIRPVWLPYNSSLGVDIYAGDLAMLLTYKIDNNRIAWQMSNSGASEGTIDPLTDAFMLNALEFSGSQGDISVSVELDVGGSHL